MDPGLLSGCFAAVGEWCLSIRSQYFLRLTSRTQLLWADRGLIDIHPQGEPVPKLAVSSGKEEWAKAARNLFRKRQYSEAMHGFERAGLHHERQVSLAYLLRDQARADSSSLLPPAGKCMRLPMAILRHHTAAEKQSVCIPT